MQRDFSYNERRSSMRDLTEGRERREWEENRKKEMESRHGKGYEERLDRYLEELKNARLPTKNKTFNTEYGVATSMGLDDLEKSIHGSTEDQFIELVKAIVHEEIEKMQVIQETKED